MHPKQQITPFLVFHIAATAFIWVFVWRHAYNMDIVADEATSFKILETGNYRALPGIANTHWLNSFFIWVISFFSNATICLRLHSIIAFPFFAHGIYRLSTLIKSDGARTAFYCLVLFNPFLLDFFALARGYGLALTFQVWTIVFFIKAVLTSFNFRCWITIIILSALTLASNLSYQYTIMAIAGGYLLYCSIDEGAFSWYTNKQKRKITLLFILLLFFTTADLLFIKLYGKDLEFGGKAHFVRSVFDSFWVSSLYQARYTSISMVLSWSSFLLILISCFYFCIKAMREKKLGTGLIASFIIGSILLLNTLFHWLFDTTYISNRTSLQWYVPGLLAIFLAISDWGKQVTAIRLVKYGFGIATGMVVIFHYVTHNNSSLCMEFSKQAGNRQPLYDLYALHPKQPALTVWAFGVYNNYYSILDTLKPKAAMFWEYPDRPWDNQARETLLTSDYIICQSPFTIKFLDGMRIPYTVIRSYNNSPFKIVRLHHTINALSDSSYKQ